MILKTERFGQLTVSDGEIINLPQGILGFPDLKKYCLVETGDDTLILWLQSVDSPEIAFPVLEPKIFCQNYSVRLSASELRELKLENINQSAVFSILTIPEDVSQMTANLKAPIVVNLKEQIAKQVVLQENEYGIKHPMFKELKAQLISIRSQKQSASKTDEQVFSPVKVEHIPPSLTVRTLQP